MAKRKRKSKTSGKRPAFTARRFSGFSNQDAAVIGPELYRLRAENGRLTAKLVLEEAREIDSPIHPYFQWDESKAAEAYRLEQAGRIIGAVQIRVIERTEKGEKDRAVKAYHRVIDTSHGDGKWEYFPVTELPKRPDLAGQIIANAKRELKMWRRRYADALRYPQFHQHFKVIFEALEALGV